MTKLWNIAIWMLPPLSLSVVGGCGESFGPLTASLGGDIAGGRGSVQVVFINNTPHRVVFTFGSYDPLDQFTQPDFGQFGADDAGRILDDGGTSAILPIECARVFSIGGAELLDFIGRNLPDADVAEEAYAEGIAFLRTTTDDDADPEGTETTVIGRAPPFEALLGADFSCGALLIIRFEFSDLGPDPFRVDFELIPSESTR